MNKKTCYPLLEIGLFRIALGIYLLFYSLPFLPKLSLYYGTQGMLPAYFLPKFLMVAPDFFPFPSLWFHSLFIAMLILTVLFTLGYLNKFTLIPLYLLQIYFYHANPMIIHEPQPLANLFLFMFFFLPPNSTPRAQSTNTFSWDDSDIKHTQLLLKIIIVFFGIYYFFVGVKKLPDPLWRNGLALAHILDWAGITRGNFISNTISQSEWLSKLFSYATLLFEISFIFLIFTPARMVLIIVGVLFHTGIFLTMEVGTLSQVLIVWYALLLNQNTRQQFKKLFRISD